MPPYDAASAPPPVTPPPDHHLRLRPALHPNIDPADPTTATALFPFPHADWRGRCMGPPGWRPDRSPWHLNWATAHASLACARWLASTRAIRLSRDCFLLACIDKALDLNDRLVEPGLFRDAAAWRTTADALADWTYDLAVAALYPSPPPASRADTVALMHGALDFMFKLRYHAHTNLDQRRPFDWPITELYDVPARDEPSTVTESPRSGKVKTSKQAKVRGKENTPKHKVRRAAQPLKNDVLRRNMERLRLSDVN